MHDLLLDCTSIRLTQRAAEVGGMLIWTTRSYMALTYIDRLQLAAREQIIHAADCHSTQRAYHTAIESVAVVIKEV